MCKDDDALSEYSDFSIVSGSRVSQIRGVNELQSSRDLHQEDLAIQKVIYYISLFSDDVKEILGRLRSNEGLINIHEQNVSVDYSELQLDNIDDEMASIILDMLEHFDMFRLCFVLCNRYNLKNHISRYLTSSCYKYSNLKLIDMNKIMKINDPIFRSNQLQVNTLSNEAIHNILNLVDPTVLSQQCTEDLDENSKLLGADSWRYIYYLGFWKKLVYLMDTHNSLKLSYSIQAFDDFKTVYLVFYRSELDNEVIKNMISDPQSDWIGEKNSNLVEYLCRKVALEQSIQTLSNVNIHESCECNIHINNSIKASVAGDEPLSIQHLLSAATCAEQRFLKMASTKQEHLVDIEGLDRFSSKYYNSKVFMETLLPLFDLFLFYGRIFESKEIRNIIKSAIEKGFNVRHKMLRVTNFVIGLIDDPSKYLKIFSPSSLKIILQALYIPHKVRVNEPSDLQLNSFNNLQMHRESGFLKMVEPFLVDMRSDRYNREFYKVAQDLLSNESKLTNNSLGNYQRHYFPLRERIKKIKDQYVGKDHEYTCLYISDLEAEYITCPMYILNHCYKKFFFSFINQTLARETIKDISLYSQEDVYSNESYNEVNFPQHVKDDYLTSLELFAITHDVFSVEKLGTLEDSKNSDSNTQNSQPKWFIEEYKKMGDNLEKINTLIKSNSQYFRYHR